jgi:Spy/CpxP family protein refolding chaperone
LQLTLAFGRLSLEKVRRRINGTPVRIVFPSRTTLFRGSTMTSLLSRLPLVVAALLIVAGPVLGQSKPGPGGPPPDPRQPGISAPPFAWWRAEPFKTELGLTADQSGRIDKIWETTRPELRQEAGELMRLEDKLSRMLKNDADESVLSRQIDRVETARANLNKTRTLMLVQMLRVLTPEQRERFNSLHARWRDERQSRRPDAQKRTEPDRRPER